MGEPIRAIVIDLEGAALPMSFLTGTLTPLAREKLGAFIAAHAEEEEIEEALEETGRLMGGLRFEAERGGGASAALDEAGPQGDPAEIPAGPHLAGGAGGGRPDRSNSTRTPPQR